MRRDGPGEFYGRCRCGGPLTVEHLKNHCPLNVQREFNKHLLEEICRAVYNVRIADFDVTHVAELGYN